MDNYCISRFNTVRTPTTEVQVGNVKIGGNNPIVVQSMTNTKTQDVEGSVKQCIQLAEAGCQIIRLTAQNLEAARALGDISKKFRASGFETPLVADIHFLPQTAMEAVEHVEKIRVNPGNFTDKRLDGKLEYTDAEYEAELDKVREKFTPLVLRCKELGRALRIGTNHGSLSDRIRLRYGDTSFGMVEAAFEFARICRDLNFHNFVFSFKASNTRIMTQTYRLASKMMKEEGFSYPLHLGVTEAGFGTEARIKSAMGIGGLLFDGLGDTIRVSLTEDPVEEVPVGLDIARLVDKIRAEKAVESKDEGIDFYTYSRRETISLADGKIGGNAVPAVASFGDSAEADFKFENGEAQINGDKKIAIKEYTSPEELEKDFEKYDTIAVKIAVANIAKFADVAKSKNVVFVVPQPVGNRNFVGEARMLVATLKELGLNNPVWLKFDSDMLINKDVDELSKLNEASIFIGSLMADGIGDIVSVEICDDAKKNAEYALAILQGARARRSRAEYIACPSCGRTLYNIQEAASKIQEATQHLKDVTIAVMGCIVNGPGEMADADFGYVGGAPGKINLYKGKKCLEVNIPQEESIQRLIELIKAEGRWIDPPSKS
ncbi:MAG: (E)-4-hydroxy-3-methylbut-2-enyl-diphosphate synthase [Opitutales bacterium]|nr:(E)-4-hydroxy-3-methylbut-2-enyl-diphosphate synthase [Opitutales bacterium]